MQEAACVSPGGPAGLDGATGPTGNSRGHGIRVTAPGPPASLIRVTAPAQMFLVRVGRVLVASRSMRNWRLGRAPRNVLTGPVRGEAGPGRAGTALDTSIRRRKHPRQPRSRVCRRAVPGARRCGRVRALSHHAGASESPAAPGAADWTHAHHTRALDGTSSRLTRSPGGPGALGRGEAGPGPGRAGSGPGTAPHFVWRSTDGGRCPRSRRTGPPWTRSPDAPAQW